MKKLTHKLLAYVFPYLLYNSHLLNVSYSKFTDVNLNLTKVNPTKLQILTNLIRFDRPVGTFLLLLPCYFGIEIARKIEPNKVEILLYFMFLLGAFFMRSAGCIINDIVDVDIDKQVERTKFRPLASGVISRNTAVAILAAFLLAGFLVLITLNWLTIFTALLSLLLVFFYPFVKRFSNLPQVVLGIAFNWGILLGYTAVANSFNSFLFILFSGSIFWTLGYDTIYAYMDVQDDLKTKVGSTAILTIDRVSVFIFSFYLLFFLSIIFTLYFISAGFLSYIVAFLIALHLLWQANNANPDNRELCLFIFKSNVGVGILIWLSLAIA